jgi:hypothetical protein
MWRALTGPFHGRNGGKWRYLCRECASTKELAHIYFASKSFNYPRPPAPKPFPPRKIKES